MKKLKLSELKDITFSTREAFMNAYTSKDKALSDQIYAPKIGDLVVTNAGPVSAKSVGYLVEAILGGPHGEQYIIKSLSGRKYTWGNVTFFRVPDEVKNRYIS